MTRDERIRAAVKGYARCDHPDTFRDAIEAALAAALADLGGLGGLDDLVRDLAAAEAEVSALRAEWRCTGCGIAGPDAAIGGHAEGCPGVEFAPPTATDVLALRADRDRLREAVRDFINKRDPHVPLALAARHGREALNASEALSDQDGAA